MNQLLWAVAIVAGYFLLFMGGVLGWAIYRIKQSGQKPPLNIKFLRGPGESLRQRVNAFNENFFFLLGAAAVAPVFAACLVSGLVHWLAPTISPQLRLSIMSLVFLIFVWLCARYSLRQLRRYRNDRLGYLGERAVGESLIELGAEGYRIFHDVPAEAGGQKFNVDHVAVGLNRVFAIETKTRRKGRARPGFEAHKVAYDGRQLIWPWTEDEFGLNQATERARWLSGWLNKMTGFGLSAQPVLAVPGWYVVLKGLGPVIVAQEKLLAGAIKRAKGRSLSDKEIDQIARLLEDRCRDVED